MKSPSTERFVGQSVPRKEDRRLLTGKGTFVADLQLPRMVHVAFHRSPAAHTRILSVDVAPALSMPGVVAALSGGDVEGVVARLPSQQVSIPAAWKNAVRHQAREPAQRVLALDRTRYVGEAVALVVAADRHLAEDAAEQIRVEWESLAVVSDVEKALEPESPLVHEELGNNIIGQLEVEKGDVDSVFASAPHSLEHRFKHHRYSAMPLECRGAVADYDERTDSLTIWSSTQMSHLVRNLVAELLGLPQARVRAIAPDVGGGFGCKALVYPEEILVAHLARTLKRPVKWVEDRSEHFISTIHARDQLHDAEVAFDDEGRILALRDRMLLDCGAWNPISLVTSHNTTSHLMGPYKIPNYRMEAKVVVTNKVPNAPYRGAGRPEAVFVMERLIDLIADQLDLEPSEVRFLNMVTPEEIPYDAGILYRDGSKVVYDSGDFPGALREALSAIGGLEAFRSRQKEAWRQNRYLGLGLGCYLEGTGVGSFEGAAIRVDPSGQIHVATGACPHGQGHETVFAQVTADLWGVTPDQVLVTAGDTAAIPYGLGTIASRSAVVVSAAIHEATRRVQEKALTLAAHVLECNQEDLEWREGQVRVKGAPEKALTLKQLAVAAKPGWDHGRPEGMDPVLEATYYYEPESVTWAYATHAAVVEVQTDTGELKIERYVVAHDAGTIINPVIVDGQIYGGVAQGLGGAVLEELMYDENGQMLNASFMDYLLPSMTEMPNIELIHLKPIPSPLNPFGIKGLGEGGAIAPPVALANAVTDALRPLGLEFNELPLRPDRIIEALLKQGAIQEGVSS